MITSMIWHFYKKFKQILASQVMFDVRKETTIMDVTIKTILDIESNCNWKDMLSLLSIDLDMDKRNDDNWLYLLFDSWWILADWGLFVDKNNPNSFIAYDDLKKEFRNNIALIKKEMEINCKFQLVLGLAMCTIPVPFMENETDEKQFDSIVELGGKYCTLSLKNNLESKMYGYFSNENRKSISEKEKESIKDEINKTFAQGTLLNEYLVSMIEVG
ncbi:hypothetical protein M2140_002164 [Clostridiales Family XIII bacterium PM5-7]